MAAKKDPRPMRSDARGNRDKLLAAARRLFDRKGFDVGVDEVAKEAALGVGTFYRHFPTKELLFQATVASHFQDLIGAARRACAADDTEAAFLEFVRRFLELGRRKKTLMEALAKQGIDLSRSPEQARAKEDFRAAVGELLARAQGARVVREGLRAEELIGLLRGTLAALGPGADEAARARVLAVITDGLRPPSRRARG